MELFQTFNSLPIVSNFITDGQSGVKYGSAIADVHPAESFGFGSREHLGFFEDSSFLHQTKVTELKILFTKDQEAG